MAEKKLSKRIYYTESGLIQAKFVVNFKEDEEDWESFLKYCDHILK
jgi:hypothetical protein